MRRFGYILLVLLGLLILAALFCGPANAVTYSGGTGDQRALIREVVESCWLPYQETDNALSEVDVVLQEHHSPYWDVFPGVAGLASFGHIWIDSRQSNPYLREIVAHEWAHQIYFTMREYWDAWALLCHAGDSSSWNLSPAENYAECMKVALFPSEYLVWKYARTDLKVIPPEQCKAFLDVARGLEAFSDLYAEDDELRGAAEYLKNQRVMLGHLDTTFGPYRPLLKRHVALICERMGVPCLLSASDYGPAQRGDVRDSIFGLEWLEERWAEPVTRGQLARLLWRSR